MFLVLCTAGDAAALWAAQGLQARRLTPLHVLTPELLVWSRTWEHRLGSGDARVALALHDGRTIDGAAVGGVLNRLTHLEGHLFPLARTADRNYALQEMTALFMSWLAALPGVVLNRAVPQGLCGSWRHPSEWAILAARAGLATRPYHQNGRALVPVGAQETDGRETSTVFVVDGHVVGDVPSRVKSQCRRLSQLSATPLLGITLAAGADGRPTFAHATPQPDLRVGGDALLDALASALAGGSA